MASETIPTPPAACLLLSPHAYARPPVRSQTKYLDDRCARRTAMGRLRSTGCLALPAVRTSAAAWLCGICLETDDCARAAPGSVYIGSLLCNRSFERKHRDAFGYIRSFLSNV